MTVLAIDRSTDVQSVALAVGEKIVAANSAIAPCQDNWVVGVRRFLEWNGVAPDGIDRIVVGMGPGSFAGIRGALAFAQGMALGIKAKRSGLADVPVVYGMPSALAAVREGELAAVVGDARRGLFWVAAYEGERTVAELRLATREELPSAVPEGVLVVTPDNGRIGTTLGEMFGGRFAGERLPDAGRMLRIASAHPELLAPEPLPIYLSPAVRA